MRLLLKNIVVLSVILTTATAPRSAQTAKSGVSQETHGVSQILIKEDQLYILDGLNQQLSVEELVRSATPEATPNNAPNLLWSGPPFDQPAGVTIDNEGNLYIVDPRIRTIFAFVPNQKPSVLFSGPPLVRPTSIAINNNQIYIADPGAKKIFAFSLVTHEIFEELHRPTAPFPDKIIWEKGKLYAYSSDSKSLIRLFSERDFPQETTDNALSVMWSIPNSDPNGFRRGEILSFHQEWSEAIDFGVSQEILYLLNTDGRGISMFPLLGGQEVNFKFPRHFEDVSRIAVSDHDICLLTSRGVITIGKQVPAILELEGSNVSNNLIRLYAYLLRNRLLPTKEVIVRGGDSVARLAEEARTLPSGYVDDFKSIFCQLNPTLCDNGAVVKPLRVGSVVLLPDLTIKSKQGRMLVELPLHPNPRGDPRLKRGVGGSLGDLAHEFAPSSTSEDALQKSLVTLNYWYSGEDILNEKKGTFVIPTQFFQVALALPEVDILNLNSSLHALLSKNVRLNSPVLYSGLQEKVAPKRHELSYQAMKSIRPQEKDPNCIQLDAQDWNRALEIIHYCQPVGMEVSNIGIVEQHFDSTHPEFALDNGESSLQKYNSTVETGPTRSDSQRKFNIEWDHGTHVAGLIGAHAHSHQVFGVQPKATIWGIRPGELVDALGANPEGKDLSEVHIFNISLGEKSPTLGASGVAEANTDTDGRVTGTEQLKAVVDDDVNINDLFVIAAGNDGGKVGDDALAARNTRSNVIVVGASDLSDPPRIHTESNRGSKHVEILAPGESISSALFGGGYDAVSGTSQAAAFVSGTAALIGALEPNWEPWKIKQRILSTANLWTNDIDPSTVFSGTLNVKSAVLYTKDAVLRFWVPPTVPSTNGSPTSGTQTDTSAPCIGRILYAGRRDVLKVVLNGKPTREIPIKNIRRFVRTAKNKNSFTIFYTTKTDEPHIPLASRIGLEMLTDIDGANLKGATEFVFVPSSDNCRNKTKINLKDLDEMTNGFY